MVAEIIGVGTELLLGDIVNTNAQYLSQQLAALGISVHYQTTVGDNKERLQRAMAQALGRSDIVITTGGLGPTSDDITKETICEGLGLQLVLHEPSLERMEQYFQRTGRKMPEINRKQAMLPRGCTIFPNDQGTAPGCAISAGKQCIIMLPGPPNELIPMFESSVREYLAKFSDAALISRNIRIIGIGESQVEEALSDLVTSTNPTVALYAKQGEVLARVTARGQDPTQAAAISAVMVKTITDRLGSYVYGVDVDSLQEVVVRRLRELKLKIATAESCTGGLLSEKITDVPGASEVFEFGVSAYANRVKVEKLRVPPKLIQQKGAISEQVAIAMAVGAMRQGKAHIGVGITGNAGPTGDEGKPVGLVYVAFCDRNRVWVKRLMIGRGTDNRDFIRHIAVLQALNMVRLYLEQYPRPLPGGLPLTEALRGKTKAPPPPAGEAKNVDQEESNLRKARKKPLGRRLKERFIPSRKDSRGEKLRKMVFLVAVAVFITSVSYIFSVFNDSKKNAQRTQSIADLYSGAQTGEQQGPPPDDYPKDYLKKFSALYALNEDIAGWIEIENTSLSYAVVQAPDNDYYLRRDFDRKDNKHGIPFVDYRVDLSKPSTNTLIYGHNMKDGQMFGELIKYKQLSYYKEHPVITFDSVYQESKFKIVAVFITNAYEAQGPVFNYHNFIQARDDQALVDFVNEIRKRSLINTTVDVTTTDTLLTLSTCDYDFKDSRMVVVARRVRPGEDAKVDVANAKLNPNPVMPQAWYAEISRKQQEELKKQQEEELKKLKEEASKWLMSSEMEGLTSEEITALMNKRIEELQKWLDEEELKTLNAKQKYELMQKRIKEAQELYKKWLTPEEIETLSASRKKTKIAENQAYARQWLSEDEINSVTTWEQILQLIATKQSGVTLNKTTLALKVGESERLIATGPSGQTLVWSSSKPEVASVGNDGTVNGHAVGSATITVKTPDGKGSASCTVTVTDKDGVTVTVNPTSVTLEKGATVTLELNVTVSGKITDKTVKWTSSNENVAKVDSNGKVTAVNTGSATITATSNADKNQKATCAVEVKAAVAAVKSVKLNKNTMELAVNETSQLTATVDPAEANQEVVWNSSNSSVASVSEAGVVTAHKAGEATITATSKDGSKSDSCKVTVKAADVPVESVEIDPNSLELEEGKTATLSFKVIPPEAKVNSISWSVEIQDVADVNNSGRVSAKKAGETTVTVTINGSKTATCRVVVKGSEQAPPETPPVQDPPSGGSTEESSSGTTSEESAG